MKRTGWVLVALSLAVTPGPPTWAASLEVLMESGRVTVNAHEAPLGEIVQALSEGAGLHVVLDARRYAQPVTMRLEAKGIHEAMIRVMREAGGGDYVIFSSNAPGRVEPFAFQQGGGASLVPQGTPAAPPSSADPPAYSVGGGPAAYGLGPGDPEKKPTPPSAPYGSVVTRSPGPSAGTPSALDGDDDDDGPAAPTARDELAREEYKRHLESMRGDLEKGAKSVEDED